MSKLKETAAWVAIADLETARKEIKRLEETLLLVETSLAVDRPPPGKRSEYHNGWLEAQRRIRFVLDIQAVPL